MGGGSVTVHVMRVNIKLVEILQRTATSEGLGHKTQITFFNKNY